MNHQANEDGNHTQEFLTNQRKPRISPTFHLAPPKGGMIDPNGLVYCRGTYHVFYQHHPFDEPSGPMHWGHMTSEDLILWRHQPVALVPGDAFDREGCLSGCAINDGGTLTLIYTGHTGLTGASKDSAFRQVQCIATSQDGIHFTKHGVVAIPSDGIMHFRDPKVWKQEGRWFMVVGARDENDVGQVLLYSGTSLFEWQFSGILAKADQHLGYVWQCPDFFPLGDKNLLMFSLQEIVPDSCHYRHRCQSGYLLGRWQPDHPFTLTQHFKALDAGHDFHAPQSFMAADGRRLIFGWMGMWEPDFTTREKGGAGCLTLPRELSMDAQGQVRMTPIRELEALRKEHHSFSPFILKNQRRRLGINALHTELSIILDMKKSCAERYGIEIADSDDGHPATRLYVETPSQRLVLDRSPSGLGNEEYCSVALPTGDSLELRIFIDHSSIEVFVNHGESCLTSRIYPSTEARGIAAYAENGEAHYHAFSQWQMSSIYR